MKNSQTSPKEQKRYQVLIENAPEAVLIYDAEQNQFTEVNKNACQLFQLSSEELLEKGPLELSPDQIYGEPTGPLAKSYIRQALHGGHPNFKWIHLNKNGQHIHCEVRLVRFPPYERKLVRASIIDLREKQRTGFSQKERMEMALTATQIGFYDYNISDGITHWDARMYQIMEVLPNAAIDKQKYFWEVVHPEDYKLMRSKMESAQSSSSPESKYEAEYRIIINEKIKYISLKGFFLRNNEGELQRIFGTIKDISEEKEAERKIQYQAALLDNISDAIISTDQHMILKSWNKGATEIYEWKAEEVIGRPISEVLPHEFNSATDQEVIQSFQKNGFWKGEVVQKTKSGKTVHILSSVTLLKNDDGEVTGTVGVNRDISKKIQTERHLIAAQEELAKITRRLQISTRAARIGIWEWNSKTGLITGDETMANIYRLSEKEFNPTFEEWFFRLHQDDRPRLIQEIQQVFEKKTTFNTEFRIIWPDQSIRHINAMGTLLEKEDGQFWMVGTHMDITEQKEAEQEKIRARQLEVKNKELEQFAYVASHDMQEPIRTIVSFSGLLKRQYESQLDEHANQYLEFIEKGALRMSELIRDLLGYSRIGFNKNKTLVDCNAVMAQVLRRILSAQILETNAEIKMDTLPKIVGFEMELRVLFQNLISNAIKFRKPDVSPQIRITVQRTGTVWQFCIADNGIGVPLEYQEKIFVIFQRLHLRNHYEGTGIGLAQCQKIVELHGGRIWVESTENKGSKFCFTIPVN